MEIILQQDVDNLGYKYDLLKVKNGYARNYLIPNGYAIIATESSKKVLAETLKQKKFKEDKIIDAAQKIADALKDTVIKVGAKASSTGKIFGSVTPLQIADSIKKLGYEVDRKQITIKDENVKTIGTYTAEIKLYKEIDISISFEVVEE